MADTVEARVTHRFAASAERVFDAWLDPQVVRRWMATALRGFGLAGDMRRVEIDARRGGRFLFSDMRQGSEAVHGGTYREIDRPRKLVFTWFTSAEEERENLSVVTLLVQPDGDGCVATLVHRVHSRNAQHLPQTEKGWAGMLGGIEAVLGADAPRVP